ncbi:hypothetical protein GETHOR_18420 [Geothrix oryzae]|uniref:Uncharacterized protein n=1 Tax=Geothrix oryzae TaxID=2927975 RepID=A0ABN6UXV3_9BACT|nr:hypothetical protein [Geothrix oryzae]BDU69741.1 hypothetical protein GETHOR_18420 [Geothrix oryzae]
MAEATPEPQPETPDRPAKGLSAAAANLADGPDADPDQYGWGV